jgi:hypothetical protein
MLLIRTGMSQRNASSSSSSFRQRKKLTNGVGVHFGQDLARRKMHRLDYAYAYAYAYVALRG